jgi:hypothetical protein
VYYARDPDGNQIELRVSGQQKSVQLLAQAKSFIDCLIELLNAPLNEQDADQPKQPWWKE